MGVILEQKRGVNMASKKLVKLLNSQRDNFTFTLKFALFLIMPKSDIHPTWYPEAKVICNGEVVMTTGSTQPEIQVDVWSGNHPFFTGTQKILDTEGRVDRFMRKYGMASSDSSEQKDQSSKEKKDS